MLTKRVIPCLDVNDGRVVKGVNFVGLRDAGDPIELARAYDEQKADEVIFLDITATSDDRATTVELASHASAELHLPYCVGGGFRRGRHPQDDRRRADKVSVNSATVANPSSSPMQLGLRYAGDPLRHRRESGARQPNKWEVYVAGGREHPHRRHRMGARGGPARSGRSCSPPWTSRRRDGFDCHLTRSVARAVDIPVIASGGVGKLEHFAEGIIEGEADASRRQRLPFRRAYRAPGKMMRAAGIPVRL